MGKLEQDQSLPSSVVSEVSNSDQNVSNLFKFVRLRCIIVVILGIAVFVSAVFSLPLFKEYTRRSDLDSLIRAHEVVATFKLRKPVSLLKANIPQIELGIYEELAVPNSTVVVIYLEALVESNTSSVVFAVVPDSKSSYISSASLSLLKSSFLSLILRQSYLRLNTPFLGDPLSFEVLKFKGGITVIPVQSVFLLQNQTFFTFTLNFSIYQLQQKFEELKNQLMAGLHLTAYENIYICLINSNGSTVAPPAKIQVSVLLTIGNRPPSSRRLKQLAQTITGPHSRNLGLNKTEFGKVKQVQLSTGMEHSLDGGGSSRASSPGPAPLPHPSHPHHHDIHLAPSPAPVRSYQAKPPSGCRIGFNRKAQRQLHAAPTVAPMISQHHSDAPQNPHVDKSPAPAFNLLASSPSLSLSSTHIHPPSHSPMSSSSAGHLIGWPFTLVLLLVMLIP